MGAFSYAAACGLQSGRGLDRLVLSSNWNPLGGTLDLEDLVVTGVVCLMYDDRGSR